MMYMRPLWIAMFLLSIVSCVDIGSEEGVEESTMESKVTEPNEGGGGGRGPRPTPPPSGLAAGSDGVGELEDISATAGNGCSIVQYCDAPGSDGTRCLHLTCDFNTAYNECIRESYSVCGTPVPVWVFVCRNSSCT